MTVIPMLTCRPYVSDDLVAVRSLLTDADAVVQGDWLHLHHRDLTGVITADAAGATSTILWQDETLLVAGRPVQANQVRMVAQRGDQTSAEGLRQALHHLAGQPGPVCHLLVGRVTRPGWDNAGFVPLRCGLSLHLPAARGLPGPTDTTLRPATASDMTAIIGLAARRNATLTGPTVRSAAAWRTWFPVLRQPVSVLLAQGPEGPSGYLRLRLDAGEPQTAVVEEWVDLDAAALHAFFGYLHYLRGLGYAVDASSLPVDRGLLTVSGPIAGVRAWDERGVAVRPGLPAFFLPALRYGAGPGRLCLGVTDSLGQWPARLELAWRDGALTAWQPTGAEPDVSLSLSTLAALAFGDVQPAAAAELGWLLPAEAEHLQHLDVWAPQPFYRYPGDERPGITGERGRLG
ncbi:MAG: sterol carrier protein domain-containing protein [Candidatus Sericytochromatia bacterium]|nr:sterol carrier protein domain-containing protein [Candidatus Sericytochromatia bacterium]